ncbi:hypothetical protein Bca101_083204 [Brassica carinata]
MAVAVWRKDAVVGRILCGGEVVLFRSRFFSGRERFYSSVVVGIPREVEAPFAPPTPVQFTGGKAYLSPSSPSCLRRVEATKALRYRSDEISSKSGWSLREFGMSDDALVEGPPDRKAIEADDEIQGSVGTVMWFRRRFEAETFKSKRCVTRVDPRV